MTDQQIQDLFREAVARQLKGEWQAAQVLYQELLERDSRHVEALHNLGVLFLANGHYPEAIDWFQKVLAVKADHTDALNNLALTLKRIKDYPGAIAALEKALRIDPAAERVYFNLGNLYYEIREDRKAIDHFRKAVQLCPGDHEAYKNLGCALLRQGDLAGAREACRQSLGIQPAQAGVYYNLGLVEMTARDDPKAVEAFTKALEYDPFLAEAYSNLGLLRQRAGQLEEAINLFKKALEANPKAADAYYNLGLAYELGHDLQKEIEIQKRALEACPDQVQAWIGGMRTFAKIADWPQADSLLSQVLNHVFPESEEALLSSVLYLLLSFPLPGRTLSARHFHWGDCIERKWGQQKMETSGNFRFRPAREARMRIGYVSPDFGRHSVGWFFRNLALRHDRERFEIHCYATDTRADDLTREIARSVKIFRPVAGLDTAGLAGVIREDGIQILVDLAGHTRQNRLDVFALKPAPVQVTAFGYPHGTGLKTMDYRITDHFADGPEADEYYRENLVRMSAFFLPLGPLEYTPDGVTRSTLGLPEQGPLLVSFNRPGKLRPEVLRLWDRILAICPEAVLAISCPFQSYAELRTRILSYFSETSNRHRIYFIERARKEEEHRGRYLAADLALDPFPYAGTTTSYEALYLNVPVITLCGANHLQRTTYSLLKHLGLEETIAYTETEYLEKATALIQDPAFLKRTKLKLQLAMQAALGELNLYVKELEQAYQIMWTRYDKGEPARAITF